MITTKDAVARPSIDKTKLDRIWAHYDRRYVRMPWYTKSWWIEYGYIELKAKTDSLWLDGLWIEERFRNEGHGRRAVDELIALGTKHRIPLKLRVRSFSTVKGNMRSAELIEWYKALGFVEYQKSSSSKRDVILVKYP